MGQCFSCTHHAFGAEFLSSIRDHKLLLLPIKDKKKLHIDLNQLVMRNKLFINSCKRLKIFKTVII